MSQATVDVVELFCVPLLHLTLDENSDELKKKRENILKLDNI